MKQIEALFVEHEEEKMIPLQPTTLSKEAIALLPAEQFTGRTVLIETQDQLLEALDQLKNYDRIGFDTETRPSFKKGQSYKVALMQVSTEQVCYLFRLNKTDIPAPLLAFLENEKVTKIGLSLKDDFHAIRKRIPFEPKGFVDLQKFVKTYGIEDASLQKIYAILFGKRISKGQRLTNWEANVLTELQQQYAALDAWACLTIYNHLNRLTV